MPLTDETTEERTDELMRVLNSTPIVDGTRLDLLDAAGGVVGDGVREARAALQAVVRRDAPATILQPLLAGVTQQPVVGEDGVDWKTDAEQARAHSVALILAWDHVTRTLPGRLRPCANPECSLFFLDRSRGGAGRWCSMAACGNRAKARRHYERHRQTHHTKN